MCILHKKEYNNITRASISGLSIEEITMLKTTKKCTLCAIEKSTTEFPKHSQKIDGLNSWCRECTATKEIARSRTVKGMTTVIYTSQRQKSKRRGHIPPSYDKTELETWITSQPNFDTLYSGWVKSEYNTYLKPSIDRIDDYKPYSLSNIRLTTWQENNSKGHHDRKNGINNKASHAVKQFTLDGVFIAEYHSLCEAQRNTDVHQSHISRACKGIYKQSGGFIWKYKE